MTGIHPAPIEFSEVEMASDPILQFFHYAHLPDALRAVSRPFCDLAKHMIWTLPRNVERTVALRKLLEAKDCAVRSSLPAKKHEKNIEVDLDEPREVGGHDPDRDGPIPFRGC